MMINVGIIGGGNVLERHLRSMRSTGGYVLKALCEIDSIKLKQYSSQLQVATYVSYEEMIRIEKTLDLIIILTPNSSHKEIALYMMTHQKDVVIEKPPTLSLSDLEEILTSAMKYHRNAYAVFQLRYNPLIQLLKSALQKDILGEIEYFGMKIEQKRNESYFSSWRTNRTLSGGILYEVGIHYFDILIMLLGISDIKHSLNITRYNEFENSLQFEAILDKKCKIKIVVETLPNISMTSSLLTLVGSKGNISIGGELLNKIQSYKFFSQTNNRQWDQLLANSDIRASVFDPQLYYKYFYSDIQKRRGIILESAIPVMSLLEELKKYYGKK